MSIFGNSKIWVRLVVGIAVMLVISLSCIIGWVTVQQQEMGIKQAREFSSSVNQMTVAAITAMMYSGDMKDRAVYLDQIQKTENISELHLIRGEATNKDFGQGTAEERKPDSVRDSAGGDSDNQRKELPRKELHHLSQSA
ncbi:MAG: hypothetical protein NTY41_04660 [Proteobacteria bacterium]|nr:hypothetical protein [Pseudomonadota bacterium]